LTNNIFIKKINDKIYNTCRSVLNQLKIRNVSKSNINPTNTNKLALKLFLTQYNTKVEQTIIGTKKSIDNSLKRGLTANDFLRRELKVALHKIRFFLIKINPINWYKKIKKKYIRISRKVGLFWGKTFTTIWGVYKVAELYGKFSSFIVKKSF
jgi:hypothetical protein